jgi:hypothetical protein
MQTATNMDAVMVELCRRGLKLLQESVRTECKTIPTGDWASYERLRLAGGQIIGRFEPYIRLSDVYAQPTIEDVADRLWVPFITIIHHIEDGLKALRVPFLSVEPPLPEGLEGRGSAADSSFALRFLVQYDIRTDSFAMRGDTFALPASAITAESAAA